MTDPATTGSTGNQLSDHLPIMVERNPKALTEAGPSDTNYHTMLTESVTL